MIIKNTTLESDKTGPRAGLEMGQTKVTAAVSQQDCLSQQISQQANLKQANLKVDGEVRLGERDLLLLCDLLTYGSMLAEHIQALYFDGRSRRRMNQRLRQLIDAGLIVRRPLPLGLSAGLPVPDASGGIPFVYRLGSAAASLVAVRLGWDVAEVRRLTRQGTPTALAHTLEVVRLRLQAQEAVHERNARQRLSIHSKDTQSENTQSKGGITALEYLPERLLQHRYELRAPGGKWKAEIFKPDALIKFAQPDGAQRPDGAQKEALCSAHLSLHCQWRHWFVEVDLGHTSSAEWETKSDIAVRYRRLGLFQKRYGAEGFQTLVLTTGERRRTHLLHLFARRLPLEDAAHFGVATFADVAAAGLLASIWHVPGQEEPVSLDNWPQAEP